MAGSPRERRHFLDVLLAITVRGYVEQLATYRRALRHRVRSSAADVETWEHVLAESGGEPDVYRLLLDRRVDAIVFTSASTVRNFVKIIGAEPAADLLRTTVVACIGPVTAEAAQQLGIRTSVMPSTYTIPALVDALVDHFRKPV